MRQRKVSGAEWGERAQMSGMRDEKGREWSKGRQGTSPDCLCPYSTADSVGLSLMLCGDAGAVDNIILVGIVWYDGFEGFYTYLSWIVLQRLPLAYAAILSMGVSMSLALACFPLFPSQSGCSLYCPVEDKVATKFTMGAVQTYGVVYGAVLGSEGTIEAVLCGVLYSKTERYTAPDRWIYRCMRVKCVQL